MIIRTKHNRENPYAQINKKSLEDDRLSFKATGVLAYLLSRPDNWETRIEQLIDSHADGEQAVRSAVNELIGAGYLHRERLTDSKGRVVAWRFYVFEAPELNPDCPDPGFPDVDNPDVDYPDVDNPDVDYPDVGFPDVENHPLNNKEINKERKKNKNYYPLPPSELPAPEVRRNDFSQNGNGNGNSAGKIRTERKTAPLIRNFMDDGPWGDLARDLGLNPESVWKSFADYLRDVHRDKGIKDLDGYCGAIESKLFNTPGLEKSNSLWQKFERHFREHRSAPITERRQNAPGCEIKLPDLPTDEEAEQGRLELKKRLSGRKSVAEVTQ